MPKFPLVARRARRPYLVGRRAPVTLNAYLAINLSAIWLDGNNLFTLFGFSHLAYLLSGHNAPAHRHAREVVLMASDWASHRATTPTSGQGYSIKGYGDCQVLLSNRRWWSRIGVWLGELLILSRLSRRGGIWG